MLPISSRFQDALTYASTLHAAQARKSRGVPYLAHLLSVAALAMEHGANEDEAIAALLHDAVEDQGGHPTLDAIRARFGDRVASIVEGCSDAFGTVGQEKAPWRQRKEQYIAHLKMADESVRLVSACDKLHNARSILSDILAEGDGVFSLFKGGKDGTLWYYRSIVEILRQAGPARIAAELDRVVQEIEHLAGSRPQ